MNEIPALQTEANNTVLVITVDGMTIKLTKADALQLADNIPYIFELNKD